jgi:hypothetical protein
MSTKSSQGGSSYVMKKRKRSSKELGILVPLLIATIRGHGNKSTMNATQKKKFLFDVVK